MHHSHRQKKSEHKQRNTQPSSRGLKPSLRLNAQQKHNDEGSADTRPGMDTGRADLSGTRMDGQGQAQMSSTRESKPAARSFDIGGPPHKDQGIAQDPTFSKPKRTGTNRSSDHNDIPDENETLQRRNGELQRHLDSLQQNMSKQHERIHQAESQLRGSSKQLRESQERVQLLEIELNNCRLENERQRSEANNIIQSMEREHTQHKAADEAHIRRLLEGATRNKVEGRWNPPPDENIRRQLNLLNTNIREWARDWATKSFVVDKTVSKETNKYFGNFIRLDPDGSLPLLVRNPSTRTKSKIAGLLLHAALSHEIHDAFFEGKIFCLKTEERVILERLFDEVRSADPKNAYIWRAGLWRLLNPVIPDGQSKVPAILETSRDNIKAYCETVGAAFRTTPANKLLAAMAENSADAQNRATRLRGILQQASTIALSLWTQQSWYSSMNLESIHRLGVTFDNSSPVLEAHPWSDVDEDNDKANGMGILMVVRPALIAFDADDTKGWHGDQYRDLSKALVLLDGKY